MVAVHLVTVTASAASPSRTTASINLLAAATLSDAVTIAARYDIGAK